MPLSDDKPHVALALMTTNPHHATFNLTPLD